MVGVYHKDIGFPAGTVWPKGSFPLRYSGHAKDKAKETKVRCVPSRLNLAECQVVEAEVEDKRVNLMVVRKRLDEQRDLVMVVSTQEAVWRVITLYSNATTDTHPTLNYSRYNKPLRVGS